MPTAVDVVIVDAYTVAHMQNHPPVTSRFWLNATIVAGRLEAYHLTHGDFADSLGLSRSYWSQLIHRKRSLTPQVRRCRIPLALTSNFPRNSTASLRGRTAVEAANHEGDSRDTGSAASGAQG